jgi:hypothetical protein
LCIAYRINFSFKNIFVKIKNKKREFIMTQSDTEEATKKTILEIVAEREQKRHDWIENYLDRNLNSYTKKTTNS